MDNTERSNILALAESHTAQARDIHYEYPEAIQAVALQSIAESLLVIADILNEETKIGGALNHEQKGRSGGLGFDSPATR